MCRIYFQNAAFSAIYLLVFTYCAKMHDVFLCTYKIRILK